MLLRENIIRLSECNTQGPIQEFLFEYVRLSGNENTPQMSIDTDNSNFSSC